jgi:phosphatidate phosphatase APP1
MEATNRRGQFRRRFKDIVGISRDAKTGYLSSAGIRTNIDAPNGARLAQDILAHEERIKAFDVNEVELLSEERVLLYPTYVCRPTQNYAFRRPGMVVDLDVHIHGHVCVPHVTGAPMSRKDRLLLGVARQISGLPSLPSSPSGMRQKSFDFMRRMSGRSTPTMPPEYPGPLDTTTVMAQELFDEPESMNLASPMSKSSSMSSDPNAVPLRVDTLPPLPRVDSISSLRQSSTWKNSHIFPSLDLETCHSNLVDRMSHFISRAITHQLVVVKILSPSGHVLTQRELQTDEYGHFKAKIRIRSRDTQFNVQASVPDRIMLTETTRAVGVIPESGVSVISDIDDTVKITEILSGPRELFRNTFVRDLSSLAVDGVREWYHGLVERGVRLHYVSNAPYQVYPVIQEYMASTGLPLGESVHLKQYSGMIAGIMENAADKKRASVENLIRVNPSGTTFLTTGLSITQIYPNRRLRRTRPGTLHRYSAPLSPPDPRNLHPRRDYPIKFQHLQKVKLVSFAAYVFSV